jgi:Na+/H+ antiporter NhaC
VSDRGERRGPGTLLTAALALLVFVALLVPQADRAALIARGLSQLLARDLDRAFDAAAPRPSLFGALDELLSERPAQTLALRVRVDGAEHRGAEIERALSAQLNRYAQLHHPSRPRVRVVPAGVDAALQLELAVSSAGDRVSFDAVLERGRRRVQVPAGDFWTLPGRSALLPPLLAVAAALTLGRTLLALFIGIYAGAVVLAAGGGSALTAPLRGLWDVFAVYWLNEILNTFRVEIIGFIVALIAMVGVMSRSGGVRGLLDRMLGFARSVRSALLVTWGMGLLIFFDDYANCMLVGSTMRPLTDRLRVSREKLAYIVDSTAAPIAGISLLSTWIAFLISVYSAQLPQVGIFEGGYALFVETLPYRFYCLFTLLFVFLVIVSGRDFGPMARAERRARSLGQLIRPDARPPVSNTLSRIEPAPGMPPDWRLAALPLCVTVGVTLVGIFVNGGGLTLLLREPEALLGSEALLSVLLSGSGVGPIFSGALVGLLCAAFLAGSNALRWAIGAGLALAIALSGPLLTAVAGRLGVGGARYGVPLLLFAVAAGGVGALLAATGSRTARPHVAGPDLGRAAAGSVGTLAFAVVLLFEAWMIGAVCRDLATADYIVALLSGTLSPTLLPVFLFVVAGLVAFSTGSSWSTMSILLPNVVALAAVLGEESALGSRGMVVVAISAVFEGSIFGDHCSPISDTTVLSSVASASDHIDHVRTQIPYAVSTGAAAIACGYLPLLTVPGWTAAWGLSVGAVALVALLAALGRRSPQPPRPA